MSTTQDPAKMAYWKGYHDGRKDWNTADGTRTHDASDGYEEEYSRGWQDFQSSMIHVQAMRRRWEGSI